VGDTGRTLACPECRKPCLRGSKFCAHCGTLLSSLDLDFLNLDADGSLPPGTLVGSYRLITVLGEGGMGRVYLAEHIKLGRRVAIKKLRRELVSNAGAVARFFAEARAVNRIFHENIVEITDIIEQPGGDNCIIMELLKGEDLAHRVLRARTLPLVRAYGIASQIASALSAAHAAGIIHRDLKPDNIFLIERAGNPDFVKVLDFGVAKLTGADDRGIAMHATAAGQIIGTPEYMSPEQARGEAVDFRADIYALGVIVYEMITGALPFQAKSFGELMMKHMTVPVELPSRQPGLSQAIQASRDRLVVDLLAKDPAERPASMAEVERRLRDLIDAILRSESSRSAASKPAEPVAKVALVRRQTPLAAVEIATPRSVSRIDVLTPASIQLESIARPLLAPSTPALPARSPTGDATRPPSGVAATPERLAKSSSDAHPLTDGGPSGAPGMERSGIAPGREASASATTDVAAPGAPARTTRDAAEVARRPMILVLRRVGLGGALAVALVGVAVALELHQPFDALPAAESAEVKIKLVSAPPGAEVRLVGTNSLLGVTPLLQTFPRSEHPATVELARPGFATVTQVIPLTGDDAVAVALTPVPAAPPAPAPVAPAPAVPAVPAAPAARAAPAGPPVPRAAPSPERQVPAAPAKRTAPPPSDPPLDRNGTMDVFKRD